MVVNGKELSMKGSLSKCCTRLAQRSLLRTARALPTINSPRFGSEVAVDAEPTILKVLIFNVAVENTSVGACLFTACL